MILPLLWLPGANICPHLLTHFERKKSTCNTKWHKQIRNRPPTVKPKLHAILEISLLNVLRSRRRISRLSFDIVFALITTCLTLSYLFFHNLSKHFCSLYAKTCVYRWQNTASIDKTRLTYHPLVLNDHQPIETSFVKVIKTNNTINKCFFKLLVWWCLYYCYSFTDSTD